MDDLALALAKVSDADHRTYLPEILHPTRSEERARLMMLLAERGIRVHDVLHGQVRELIRTHSPDRRSSPEELDRAADAHLQGHGPGMYGVWVHYPWSGRLVHMLDEEEFALVRTDRNRNKITREEQQVLSTKKVGVIGLSVGQSVALTMALERGFGEIRLADHDILELSNLNRIRSGVHALGANKVINVAREIAEIDPFLKVVCFTEGIDRDNINAFLTDGGDLDILIEECDSVDVKVYARQHAKRLGIPVVMDTSDRGLVDVERFDLEPERPILHGLIDDLDLAVVERPMSDLEKMPFLGRMVGMETLSDRMKRSLPEVGKTLVTWPQLASGVVLGGALVTEIVRRVLLGIHQPSGRWWNDFLTGSTSAMPQMEPTRSNSEE
ncbi:MAG: ThiF family adenylyltransferase [Flavobacteriales bacterium]|nr:ThiF family adenylyltransferase [Flavobacteriales bacterium]